MSFVANVYLVMTSVFLSLHLSLTFPLPPPSHVTAASRFRWLVVKDSFLLYMRPEDGQVGTVILYDKGFHIKIGTRETGVRHGVTLENLCR